MSTPSPTSLPFHGTPSNRVVLFFVEMSINVVGLITTTLFCIILARTQTIHRYMKASLFNLVITLYVVAISRFLILPNVLSGFSIMHADSVVRKVVDIIHDTNIYTDYFLKLVIVVERVASIKYADTYEHRHNACVTATIFMAPWPPTIIFTLGFTYGYLNHFLTKIALAIVMTASYAGIIALKRANDRLYRRRNTAHLSERYQLTENVRTNRAVFWWCSVSVTRNFLVFLLSILLDFVFWPLGDKWNTGTVLGLFDVMLAVYSVVAPAVIVAKHDEMRRVFRTLFFKSPRVSPESPRNVFGERMIIDLSEHKDEYFKALNAAWS